MTIAYLNCLKPYISLCCQTKTKLPLSLLLTLPFSKLSLSLFSSLELPTKFANPPIGFPTSKEQTLLSLSQKCCTLTEIQHIHAHVLQCGLDQNLYVMSKIIVFCAVSEQGCMNYAVSVFENIDNPDGFLWNTMIRGFGRTSQVENAFGYFNKMLEEGHEADNFTYSFLIKVSGQLGLVKLGKQIHSNTIKHGLETHVFVRNILIHMYGMFRDSGTAYQLFEEIPKPDLVAWNTIIKSHVCCGKYKEALELFSRMQQCGMEPDGVTLAETLLVCSALGALDFGRWVHSRINKTQLVSKLSVCNSLIDMYANCGAEDEAYRTFNEMTERNTVTWNSIILGLARNGHPNDAIELFSRMLNEKLQLPDDITFLGVLSACTHGGMVEEGQKYFDSMMEDYLIQPTIKHYGSMVDMLGRAGLVEEAYRLITSMPMKCNAIVWRTLLAACRVHGHIKLGEVVRRHLLELEPDFSSDYVLLANIYASAGQWNNVTTVRRTIGARRIQKPMPGNSSSIALYLA